MPLPIVHLGVAKNLAPKLGVKNLPNYYLGAISPDAIHMRKNHIREDKHNSHLHIRVPDITKFITSNKTNDSRDFYLGYGIHILTDIYWAETIHDAFTARYNNDPNPIQDATMAYYNDTDRLDFELYFNYEHRLEIWDILANSTAMGIDGLVSADEVNAWKERTLHWFDSGDSQHKNPIKYIGYSELLNFMTEAATHINEQLQGANKLAAV